MVYCAQRLSITHGKSQPKEDAMSQQPGALDPHYTFSRFSITATNQSAVEICRTVATRPGLAYNPLFFYGSAATGKTHLLHAIGNQIHAQTSSLKIVYLSCKQLMMQRDPVTPSVGLAETRARYPKIDVLLLDDLDHLAGYTALQHELLYLITALHHTGKQLVIVADRTPQALAALISRLRARCAAGMVIAVPSSA
jgi:chromosomal replication initiator protein